LIPSDFFIIDLNFGFSGEKSSDGKHGSLTTIFSTWNAMAGTGIVCMPYAFQESGIMIGILLTFIAFAISYYTCWMVIRTAGTDIDYTDTLKRNFGQNGWYFGMTCFIMNLYVPILIFFQLMAQNLCPVLLALIDLCSGANTDMNTKPNWGEFNYTWTCVIIFFIVFAMTAIKDLNIFVRINSFGVIFITLIILMIMGLGFYSFSDTKFTYNESTYD
jgi:amino acid permease